MYIHEAEISIPQPSDHAGSGAALGTKEARGHAGERWSLRRGFFVVQRRRMAARSC